MPSQAETPHKPCRRPRRPPRKSAGPASSQLSSSRDAELSGDPETDKQSNPPTRILRRGDPVLISDVVHVTPSGTPAPHTPPRPKSMCEGSVDRNHNDGSASKLSETKNRNPKARGRKQSGSMSPMPAINGTPIPAQPQESTTPNRANGNPMKAYAGPTFHASPAASSLPIPKFYSKSVPNMDKTKSLRTMMEQEASGSSSESEESSSFETAQLSLNSRAKEESPLDIFFRAGREVKGCIDNALDVRSCLKLQANVVDSASGPAGSTRHNSHLGSVGGLFPMEMDGAPPEVSSEAKSPDYFKGSSKQHSSENSASAGLTEADREEQRKAQSIALKKLLYSPRDQVSRSGPAGQRPPSSNLRKEILVPTSPENTSPPELPATPTPLCKQNIAMPATTGQNTSPENYISPYHSDFRSKNLSQAQNPAFTHDITSAKSIENDLRRILKLDVLSNDGVAGN